MTQVIPTSAFCSGLAAVTTRAKKDGPNAVANGKNICPLHSIYPLTQRHNATRCISQASLNKCNCGVMEHRLRHHLKKPVFSGTLHDFLKGDRRVTIRAKYGKIKLQFDDEYKYEIQVLSYQTSTF